MKKSNAHAYTRKKINKFLQVCHYCETKTLPYYRDASTLLQFTSERGKILSHGKTGVCSKHQRKLTIAIKRARHLALIPFVSS